MTLKGCVQWRGTYEDGKETLPLESFIHEDQEDHIWLEAADETMEDVTEDEQNGRMSYGCKVRRLIYVGKFIVPLA